jgi:hypothetical protein
VEVQGFDDCHAASLATPEATTSGRFDSEDVSSGKLDGGLRWELVSVEEVPSGRARFAPLGAGGSVPAALAEDGGAAVLERLELADDAVAASVQALAARAEPELVAAHAERIRKLERLDRSRQRVRHRHVDP